MGRAQTVEGIAVLDKRVVLYGSEGSVNIFKSDPASDGFCDCSPHHCKKSSNLPTAVLEAVAPVILDAKIVESCMPLNAFPDSELPDEVCGCFKSRPCFDRCGRRLVVTIGIFSVVRLERPAQYLVSGAEYSVPTKECKSPTDRDPCGMFRRMPFPVDEFYPPSLSDVRSENSDGGCCPGRK